MAGYRAIVCPEGKGKFTLEVFDTNGVWMMAIQKNRKSTFVDDLERQASGWKHTDKDIYRAILFIAEAADLQESV